jgi:hypothetical protein
LYSRPGVALRAAAVALALFAAVHPAAAQVLTNIAVSPANPAMGAGSNQQFTATGQYDDGNSLALTNGGGGGGNWTMMAGLPSSASMPAFAAVEGQLYVVGAETQQVYVYDPGLNAWGTAAPFVNSWCCYSGAAVIGSQLFIIGGCTGSDCGGGTVPTVAVFDAVANSWSNAAPMHVARNNMAVGVINGKIYVAGGGGGGLNYNKQYNSLEVYDPAVNAWTLKSSMPTARYQTGGVAINGKFYVVGGYNNSNPYLNTLEIYDPQTDTWSTGAPMPTPRNLLGVTTVGGLLYAMGGMAATGITNLVEEYDPVADSWSTGAPMLNADYGSQQPAALNGAIYIVDCAPFNSGETTNMEALMPAQSLLWSSSSPAVASIDTNGVAAALANGVTTITATSGSVSGNATLTVVSPPSITVQPTNDTVSPDGSVTLSVGATGGGLCCQWQLDGTNITGATGPSLTISDVCPANVGAYTVIVSNAAGSVTSASVLLATLDIQMFSGVIVNGAIGSNYLIQATSNLPGGWTTLTNVALPAQPYIYIDYNSPTNGRQFYRAVPQ